MTYVEGFVLPVPAENLSVPIDHEQRSFGEAVLLAIDAVLLSDRTLGLEVAQEREVEMARVPEGCVAPDAVYRDADDVGTQAMKLRVQLVIEAHLVTADGTEVGGIEDKDHQPAAKFLK